MKRKILQRIKLFHKLYLVNQLTLSYFNFFVCFSSFLFFTYIDPSFITNHNTNLLIISNHERV